MNNRKEEFLENLILWFLFSAGFAQISLYPVTSDDEVAGALFFVAFGLCKIAKSISKRPE